MPRVHRSSARFITSVLILGVAVFLPSRSAAVEWLPGGVPFESHAGSVTELVSMPDYAGGMIVAWVQGSGDSIFAQRVDADGNRLWGTNGVTACGATGLQTALRISSDGTGGIVLAWTDTRADALGDIYVQRIGWDGTILWTADGVALTSSADRQNAPDIVSDFSGGAIATWVVNNADIAVRSIDSSGAPEGPANGTTICAATGNQTVPRITHDGAGGAIVTWMDGRVTGPDIYAARFTAAGSVPWTPDGVPVIAEAGNHTAPGVVSDGAGGAIVVMQYQLTIPPTPMFLIAQRIDGSGVQMWGSSGVPVRSDPTTGFRSLEDGAGGVYVVAGNLFAQRLDMNGDPQWGGNGLSLGAGAPAGMALDGSGRLLACWVDGTPGIRAQAISAVGVPQWDPDGVPLGTAVGGSVQIAPDNAGGALVAWDGATDDVYGMRVLAGGELPFLRPSLNAGDLPDDEGGWVRLLVDLNTADSYPTVPEESGFAVWRRIAPPAGAAAMHSTEGRDVAAVLARARAGKVRLSPALAAAAGFPPGTWETVGFHPSLQIRNYTVAAPTRADSTASADADEVFVVVTHTTTPTVWYVSGPDSGHSVDNLAPDAPQNLAGAFEPASTLHLTWTPNAESDLHRYAIHRGAGAGFTPAPSNLLGYATEAAFDDVEFIPGSYYKVSAIDRHGNESAHALLTPQQVAGVGTSAVPAAAFLAPPAPNPVIVACGFEFGLSRDGPARVELFDVAGRRVRTLRDGNEIAGAHRADWDLRDGQGRRVGPGLYWVLLRAEGRSIARRFAVSD